MHRRVSPLVIVFAVACAAVAGSCSAPPPPPSEKPAAEAGKIPVTTKSEEAKKEYLEGRSLAERLLVQDSIAHFDKAISLDPNFALAELGRANSATNLAAAVNRQYQTYMQKGYLTPQEQEKMATSINGALHVPPSTPTVTPTA